MRVFDIPKIVKPLPIAEYAEGSEAVVWVWLNVPQDVLREHGEIIRESVELREKMKSLSSDVAQVNLDEIGKQLEILPLHLLQ
jgi:hypothetical protein